MNELINILTFGNGIEAVEALFYIVGLAYMIKKWRQKK
jgi:hypothetical protein